MKIHIKNGRLIDPKNNIDAKHDVYIAAGKIVAIGSAPGGFTPNKTIDATNQIVIPGLVDLAARLREPGYEYKAKLESEMAAAAAGGVTSLACPPDTDPPLDEPGLVEMLKQRAKSLNMSHVYPVGALTVGLKGERLTEMSQLTAAGCVAFSQADAPITDTQVLMRAMEYAATFGYPVWLRPQDAYLARGGVAHDGEVATRLGRVWGDRGDWDDRDALSRGGRGAWLHAAAEERRKSSSQPLMLLSHVREPPLPTGRRRWRRWTPGRR